MSLALCLAAVCCWAAVQMEPGTLLPPLSWPIIAACIWLLHVQLWDRLSVSEKRQALAGLISSAMMMVFLLQDEEFAGWGDVYYFCGSHMQYCTCAYNWNTNGWNKAIVLWGFVLTSALGLQRLLVQQVLQGLLPGEEVVTRESLISIFWRLIPYWLNNWEKQWGAEVSSMMFELPQFAVELLVILPCVQILASRMKVLALPSVNAALPRGWDGASAEQVEEAFVPNVQRGCWERRPEQRHIWERIKANRHVSAFAALLCLLACFNSLYVPMQLEQSVMRHPRTALMQAAGRIPTKWATPQDLGDFVTSSTLQRGTLQLTHSFVTHAAVKHAARSKRFGPWRLGSLPDINVASPEMPSESLPVRELTTALPARQLSSFMGWVSALEEGPWQHNSTWASEAVGLLQQDLEQYSQRCPDVSRFKHIAWKHHFEVIRMQDPNHKVAVPLIEAALALMRLSTEKFFVLLSLYVAFLLFRTPPPYVAALIGLNARISSAFARLVLYSFPFVCWAYGAGVLFSTLVSLVFWGGPAWQVYHGLRTHACTVTVKGLRPATAVEVERMHNDCAICWSPMTVPGPASQPRSTSSTAQGGEGRASSHTTPLAGPAADDSRALAAVQQQQQPLGGGGAAGAATSSTPAAAEAVPTLAADRGAQPADVAAVEEAQQALALADTDGSTLPCGHCYHQACLTQWLQQCHAQGTAPTCPMCQARMQLAVKWHVMKALLAPAVWQLPTRQRGDPEQAAGQGAAGAGEAEGAAVAVAAGAAGAAVAPAHNNYLLRRNPRLAEMLADMPQFLAPENVQLLADVQELRWQRQQLANELQIRQQQLQQLEGRHHELQVRLVLQQQQLITELERLVQLQQQQRQQQQQAAAAAAPQEMPGPGHQAPRQQDHRHHQQQQQSQEPQQQQQPQQRGDQGTRASERIADPSGVPAPPAGAQEPAAQVPGAGVAAAAGSTRGASVQGVGGSSSGSTGASQAVGAPPAAAAGGVCSMPAEAAPADAGGDSSSCRNQPRVTHRPQPPASQPAAGQQQQEARRPPGRGLRWRFGRRA